MASRSLSKMAAGGIYDHVGGGFHRYAVDKEWYVPHFEKMLYNQAQLARIYTDAARLCSNAYFADIAKSIFDFVAGPLTDGGGAFYSAIDAETDGVEGAYYAWSAPQFDALLAPEEVKFMNIFYALADIPEFPGHKHVDGKALIARKPFDRIVQERSMPYVQLAAMTGQVMNKLLAARNKRPSPRLDNKIIVSWNGLMMDALAHAAIVFNKPEYIARARAAADFILEHAIDNEGRLCRIYAGGKPHLAATLEDYAFLIKGLLSLIGASFDPSLLEAAKSLCSRVEEEFGDASAPGFFYTPSDDGMLVRIKSGDDSSIPNANAVMMQNFLSLYALTHEVEYQQKAQGLAQFFLSGNDNIMPEFATMLYAALPLDLSQVAPPVPKVFKALRLNAPQQPDHKAAGFDEKTYFSPPSSPEDVVQISATLFPVNARGDKCEVIIALEIKDGWHINAANVSQSYLIPTQIDIQGEGVECLRIAYPEALHKKGFLDADNLQVYEGLVHITAYIRLADTSKTTIKMMARFQPCHGTTCYTVKDIIVSI